MNAYIAVQTLGRVTLWCEAVVFVRALSAPRLAGHTQYRDGGWTSVRVSIPNLAV